MYLNYQNIFLYFSAQKNQDTHPGFIKVKHRGFEPRTTWLKVKCSTDWANAPYSVKCPEPESNQWHEDFQSSALPTELSGQSSGDRIWTYDLRVMSPTSFQTAPSRDILFLYLISQVKPMIGLEPITCWLQISCSANWATSADCLIGKWVVVDSNHRSNLQQIYSLSPLATRETTHKRMGPTGLEPVTLCL